MNSEKSQTEANKPEFTGCVEFIPPLPAFIEFITPQRLWGIPSRKLFALSLRNNPESDAKRSSPTDLLSLAFQTHLVLLFGWRLDLMLDPLMQGRLKRVHARKYPGTLVLNEPWVSKIVVLPLSISLFAL